MARLVVDGADIRVRLNPVERLAPLEAVSEVTVLERTDPETIAGLVRMGAAASAAPLAGVATIGPRARTRSGTRACIVTYLSRPGVLVRLRGRSRWGLLVVSSRHADQVADTIRKAVSASRAD